MLMNRQNLHNLALAKKNDARLLFENGRWSNAYYLYGYAIEIALKACIAKRFLAETIPDRKIVVQTYTHKITDLAVLAQLETQLAARRQDRQFNVRWGVVEQWSEEARYAIFDERVAVAMHDAVENETTGAFQWIAGYW